MQEIILERVNKIYQVENKSFYALCDVSLSIKKGEIVTVLGPSGSGKTTLLNVVSGLDRVSSGAIYYDEKNIVKFSDRHLTNHRRLKSGFIFQNYNLLEYLNVKENILIGSYVAQNKIDIADLINVVGLEKHQTKSVYQLSGGEQQRVSIARAVAKNPEVLFCDEPTGALDEEMGKNVLDKLVEINEKMGTTIILVTHNPGIAEIGDRVIKMNSGKIFSDEINKRKNPHDIEWA